MRWHVGWQGAAFAMLLFGIGLDAPLIKAIMLRQSGNAGISFGSRCRTLTSAAERQGAIRLSRHSL